LLPAAVRKEQSDSLDSRTKGRAAADDHSLIRRLWNSSNCRTRQRRSCSFWCWTPIANAPWRTGASQSASVRTRCCRPSFPHPPGAEWRQDLVGTETIPRCEGHPNHGSLRLGLAIGRSDGSRHGCENVSECGPSKFPTRPNMTKNVSPSQPRGNESWRPHGQVAKKMVSWIGWKGVPRGLK
jgi:hypothetical protein